jgi:uncharacterized protein
MINYFKIINKYYDFNSPVYREYVVHTTLVANKALQIGKKLGLDKKSLEFIEEASMLHDIGICKTDYLEINCDGSLPYIQHGIAGSKILITEGLPKHANVAMTHTGVGIFKSEIEENNLPLPARDYVPESLEEKIISYADLFYSKFEETLWQEKSLDEVRKAVSKYGDDKLEILENWIKLFEK